MFSCDAATLETTNTSLVFIKLFAHAILVCFAHLEASVSPGKVTTGVPVQRTSIDVVWPLQSGVSKQTSANWPRRTCSSLAATFEKMIRPGPKPLNRNREKCKLYILHQFSDIFHSPRCCVVCSIFGSPTAGNRSNHKTAFGTFFKIVTHDSNVNGSILYSWLKLQ